MLRNKQIDRICRVGTVLMLALAILLWGVVEPVRGDGSHAVGYESWLFDQSAVHTIDITMADWDGFIANATAEEYVECDIAIDGEKFSSVAIRAKGNTSLSSVSSLGSTRYSFKVEFDHFVKGMTYHGLDKLSLNNLIQDATMMKDYLAYTLMNRMGVPSPLCSYVQINVNGEPWGLYLAVEGVEDAFMDRNGMTKGELYKPDSLSFGGGRGNGRDFDFENFRVNDDEESAESDASAGEAPATGAAQPGEGNNSSFSGMPDNGSFPGMPGSFPNMPDMGGGFTLPDGFDADAGFPETPGDGTFDFGGMGMFNFGMGSEDVKLIYSDDDPESYSNIFNNAKTEIKDKDKTRLIESLRKLNAKEDIESVVNTDEVINYLAVHNFLCNDDSYTGMMVHNYYLYEEKGELSIIPWDYNLGFGGFSAGSNATSTVNSPIDSPVSSGTTDSRPLIAWIFADDESLAAYHDAYDRFISENIESGWLAEEIDRVKAMISPYLEKDESAFYDMEAFEKAVDTLQTFCQKRGESVRGQLDGTIPSTTQEQRTNSAALVDASDISTGDMGSMNSGGNGFGCGGGGFGGFGDSGDRPGRSGRGDGDGRNSGGDGAGRGFGGGNFQMPGGMPDFSGDQGNFTPPSGFSGGGQDFSSMTPPSGFGGAPGQGGSENSAQAPAETQKPSESSAAPDESRERPSRPEGFAGGGDFPFASQQADRSGQWAQLAVWSAILLAAVLAIRRVAGHNG